MFSVRVEKEGIEDNESGKENHVKPSSHREDCKRLKAGGLRQGKITDLK